MITQMIMVEIHMMTRNNNPKRKTREKENLFKEIFSVTAHLSIQPFWIENDPFHRSATFLEREPSLTHAHVTISIFENTDGEELTWIDLDIHLYHIENYSSLFGTCKCNRWENSKMLADDLHIRSRDNLLAWERDRGEPFQCYSYSHGRCWKNPELVRWVFVRIDEHE